MKVTNENQMNYKHRELKREIKCTREIKFASLNKQASLSDYFHEVYIKKGYSIVKRILITDIIEFTDWYSWNYFTNSFMERFDLLEKKGGSSLLDNDPRIEEIDKVESFFKLSEEQRRYCKENCYTNCVLVKYGNKRAYIDPQGYSYARYVGIV